VIPRNWRYAWHNSADRRIVRTRGWVDAAASARPQVVRSLSSDGGPVLAYGGLTAGTTHVLDFLEQRRGGIATRTARRSSWSALGKGDAVPDADLLLVGYPRRNAPAELPAHSLLLPFRITLGVLIDANPDAVVGRISRKARQQHAREQRARRRTLRIATDEADLVRFYADMHRPTMASRHGAAARSESLENARACLFRHGVLFLLMEDDEAVAGMLCRIERQTLFLRLAGVAGGGTQAYESGTYMALYIMIFQWAAAHRFSRVDLSGCEPFLSKGLLQFKRKMHPEITLPANHFADKRLTLTARRDSPAVRDFLVANPVLAMRDDDALDAVYFHDDDRAARLDLRWQCPGVAGHRLIHLDQFLAGLPVLRGLGDEHAATHPHPREAGYVRHHRLA
jgi:hypothetical protein